MSLTDSYSNLKNIFDSDITMNEDSKDLFNDIFCEENSIPLLPEAKV